MNSSPPLLVAAVCTIMCASVHGCDQKALKITELSGFNLPTKDIGGMSDPYLEFTAFTCNGASTTLSTSVINNEHNPVWNEALDFGVDKWRSLLVGVWDEDIGQDDLILNRMKYTLQNGDIDSIETVCEQQNCPPNPFVQFKLESKKFP